MLKVETPNLECQSDQKISNFVLSNLALSKFLTFLSHCQIDSINNGWSKFVLDILELLWLFGLNNLLSEITIYSQKMFNYNL